MSKVAPSHKRHNENNLNFISPYIHHLMLLPASGRLINMKKVQYEKSTSDDARKFHFFGAPRKSFSRSFLWSFTPPSGFANLWCFFDGWRLPCCCCCCCCCSIQVGGMAINAKRISLMISFLFYAVNHFHIKSSKWILNERKLVNVPSK